jgi:hypothetical protein
MQWATTYALLLCLPRPPKTELTVSASQWKVLVVDETSRKLLDNVVKEDDILNHNVTSKHGSLEEAEICD